MWKYHNTRRVFIVWMSSIPKKIQDEMRTVHFDESHPHYEDGKFCNWQHVLQIHTRYCKTVPKKETWLITVYDSEWEMTLSEQGYFGRVVAGAGSEAKEIGKDWKNKNTWPQKKV